MAFVRLGLGRGGGSFRAWVCHCYRAARTILGRWAKFAEHVRWDHSEEQVQVNGQEWSVFAVGGSPAQSVLHGVLDVMKRKPDLVVSGINYGENVASGVTISGTVGAAMEAASLGIPAMAVSLEAHSKYHLSYSMMWIFRWRRYFTRKTRPSVSGERNFRNDVHLLKVDVPSDATQRNPLAVDACFTAEIL